jgi:hypothetical protein
MITLHRSILLGGSARSKIGQMLISWQRYFREIFKSPYTRGLEVEVERLRDENRALINSILGIAGLPPLRLDAEVAREKHRAEIEVKARRSGAAASEQESVASGHDRGGGSKIAGAAIGKSLPLAAGQGIVLPANAHRRRSWQQINRILEIEETRQITNRDNSEAMQPKRSS